MSLYSSKDKAQNSAIGRLKEHKVNKDKGIFVPPKTDPKVAGAIWNDAGTLKISTGS